MSKHVSGAMRTPTRLLATCAVLLLGACSSIPQQLQGEYPPLVPRVTSERDIGTQVRWGGIILAAQPEQDRTCFEILSRELGSSMRPRDVDLTQGRFIACQRGFHDPEVFAKGREVTVIGQLQQIDLRKVGDFNYRYPVLAADFITMWPERPDVIIRDYYDPFYHPWYWGPYRYPFAYPYYGPYPRARASSGSSSRVDIGPAPEQEQ